MKNSQKTKAGYLPITIKVISSTKELVDSLIACAPSEYNGFQPMGPPFAILPEKEIKKWEAKFLGQVAKPYRATICVLRQDFVNQVFRKIAEIDVNSYSLAITAGGERHLLASLSSLAPSRFFIAERCAKPPVSWKADDAKLPVGPLDSGAFGPYLELKGKGVDEKEWMNWIKGDDSALITTLHIFKKVAEAA